MASPTTFLVLSAILMSGSSAGLQAAPVQTVFGPLVTITVAEDRHYTLPHEILIEAGAPVMARTRAELEGRVWQATRTSERGVEVIRSDACPALQHLALSFAGLPAIPVRPMASRVHGEAETLAPTRKDGFATHLTFSTQASDGSYATVQIDGGNAYAQWGHDAVVALQPCWGPLTP